ncbi:MAG: hypothetical protein ACRDHZ_23515, partial [Ktedonobacteraceae bacterium]
MSDTINVADNVTWRTLLDEIVLHLSTEERHEFYQTVGVNRLSIRRWRTGENKPAARHLMKLIEAVPAIYRDRFRALIMADPKVRRFLSSELPDKPSTQEQDRISQRVYERVLRVAHDTPDRFWILSEIILSEALNQLETKPMQTGLEILVVRCMPPREDGKIRSLRTHVALGSGPWRADLHLKERFLGVETLAGYAIM